MVSSRSMSAVKRAMNELREEARPPAMHAVRELPHKSLPSCVGRRACFGTCHAAIASPVFWTGTHISLSSAYEVAAPCLGPERWYPTLRRFVPAALAALKLSGT